MTVLPDNPLATPSTLPHGAPPLDAVKPAHFLPAIRAAILDTRAKIAAIRDNPAAPDFQNTIEALERAKYPLTRVANVYGNIAAVKNNDELMAVSSAIKGELAGHASDVMGDAALFARVKAVYDSRDTLNLDAEQAMLLKRTYTAFVRNGALLDDDQKRALKGLDAAIAARTNDFQNNLMKAYEAYTKTIDDEALLEGVPARVKAQFRQAAEEQGKPGKWVIGLMPPPYELLENAENRKLRQEIYLALGNVANGGAFDNNPVVLDIVRLRHEKAQLLGHDSYARFMLQERMAKTPEAVIEFLDRTQKTYRPAAEAQLKKVQDFALKTDGLNDLQPWDFAYYNRRLQEETYRLNVEDLRPYFSLETVLKGLHEHVEKLFGITLTEDKSGKYKTYDPDVRVYEISDKATGAKIGVMYGDFYARAGEKNGGAWMEVFRDKGMETGANDIPVIINCLNLAKPTAETPSLLSLDDVRTIFHEFGHGMHALLAEGKYASQNGINVKWDFIELPSQLQENWVLQPEALKTFAKHWQTGETMPDELMHKAIALESFNAGINGMNMHFRSMLDMTWYMTDPATIKSAATLEKQVIDKHSVFGSSLTLKSTSFDHIFSGGADYAAGYYSYKWAEVLDADVFDSFREKGLYDADTAKRVRSIYSTGGNEEPDSIFRRVKGRDPDPDALFRREGLLAKKKQPPAGPKAPRP